CCCRYRRLRAGLSVRIPLIAAPAKGKFHEPVLLRHHQQCGAQLVYAQPRRARRSQQGNECPGAQQAARRRLDAGPRNSHGRWNVAASSFVGPSRACAERTHSETQREKGLDTILKLLFADEAHATVAGASENSGWDIN